MTTTTAEVQPLSIDFGAITGADEGSSGPASSMLDRVDVSSPTGLKHFSARSSLSEAQLDQVRAIAQKKLPGMLDDRNELSDFGLPALDGVNGSVQKISATQRELEMPEVEAIVTDMEKSLRNFGRKYNPADPKMVEAFDNIRKFMDGVADFFRLGKDLLQDLYNDSLSVEVRLDKCAAKLVKHREAMKRNVFLCDELYDQNEKAITQLTGVIAVMEQIHDDAHDRAQQLTAQAQALPKGNPERRRLEEQATNTTEFVQDVDMRISEFIQRLFVAYAMSPLVRNIRRVSYGLEQRISLLINLTIPVMKQTVATWGLMLQAKQAGEVGTAAANANDRALSQLAQASGQAIPEIARAVFVPSTRPETMMELAQSVVSQNNGIVAAAEEFYTQKARVEDAMVRGVAIMHDSGEETNAKIIDLVSAARAPIAELPAPEVPDQILELAS